MLDISKLSVMACEHSFNIIHQILDCFTNCFYLLFSFCLYCSLCRYFLGQLLVSWVKPFRAANRMFKTGALKITETFLYLYPEIKFNSGVDATAKWLAADGINSVTHSPLEGLHSIRVRTHDGSDSARLPILLYSPLSGAGEAPVQRLSCWTAMQTSTSVDSVWEAQIMQRPSLRLLLF